MVLIFKEFINSVNDKNRFNDIIENLTNSDCVYKTQIIAYLDNLKNNKEQSFCNDLVLKNIISMFINLNNNDFSFDFYFYISEYLYKKNVFIESDKQAIEDYLKYHNLVIKIINKQVDQIDYSYKIIDYKESVSHKKIDNCDFINKINKIYNSFNNKELAIKTIELICSENYNFHYLDGIVNYYIVEVRKYFSDEQLFYNSVINLINNKELLLKPYGTCEQKREAVCKQLCIYDIDNVKIDEFETKIKKINEDIAYIEEIIKKSKVPKLAHYKSKIEKDYLTLKEELSSFYSDIKCKVKK